ncbi:hypothetical protein D3C78_1635840 [compost metagenome]
MIESPIDHGDLVEMQDVLRSIGLDVSLLDIINCGLTVHDIMETAAARKWLQLTPEVVQQLYIPDLEEISNMVTDQLRGVMAGLKINCKAVLYEHGDLLLELSHDVEWDDLNRFNS